MIADADTILLPELYGRRQRRSRHRKHKGGGFMKFILVLFLILVVSGALLSLADIGGNIVLSLAKNYLSENYKLELKAEKITGNPIVGYTLHNFSFTDMRKGREIFSAGSLICRINFPAVIAGKMRLSEISLGGISMDVDQLIETAKNLQDLPALAPSQTTGLTLRATPAFADEEYPMPDIPIDRFSIADSRFSSQFGVLDVIEIGAEFPAFDVDIDAELNGLPIKGNIDMGESAGLTAANIAEIFIGSGKITATGGLIGGRLDLHTSAENFDLEEATAIYPAMLKPEDFSGTANFTADITGTLDDPRFSGSIDYKGTKIYGFPVERASANINYSYNRISVSNIQASAFNIPVQGEIAAAMRTNQPVSVMVKLDGSETSLDGLDEVFGVPALKALSGKVSSFSANISGPVNSLNGLVSLNAPKIAYDGKALTDIRAQMKLAKSDTANVEGKFAFEGVPGFISGSVASLLVSPKMNITAKIAGLDVKRIESMIPDGPQYQLAGNITASVNVKGTPSNPAVTGSISSPEFSGMGQKITKPAINFTFADKTLTLSKTEGSLNGMPINVNGTIGPLPSENPNLNISATISMTPSALKAYVPDIEQYALKGTVNAGLKVQGSVSNPAVNLIASSPKLEAMNMASAKNIELTTALKGDLASLERITVNTAAESITASGVTFSGVNAIISKNGDNVMLGGFNAKSGTGTITGAGTASVSGKSPLDFSFRFTDLDLAPLATASGIDLKGKLTGSLKVSGNNTNPAVTLTADIPALNAMGFALDNITADIAGNMDSINLKRVRAEVEGAEVRASGTVRIMPSMNLNIELKGNNIQLERLLKGVLSPDTVTGNANLVFTLTGGEKNLAGKGTFTAPNLKAYGIKLSGVNFPLSYSGSRFSSSGGSAKLYGGSAKNEFAFNVATMTFTDSLEVSGVDVNGLIQDVSGGLEGKITGTGKLLFRLNGRMKDKVTYSGSGNFTMGSGGITGFKWLDIVAKIHGRNGINYASVNAPITLQTGKLILKAGSVATAPNNDSMYKYAKLSQNGTINFGGKDVTLNLPIEANINYQLINALQGGSKGGFEALFKGGVSNLQDGLKAFLSGGLTEARKVASTGDYRTITLNVTGKAASPSISGLRIGASQQTQTQNQVQQTQTQNQIQQKKQEVTTQIQQKKQEIATQVQQKKEELQKKATEKIIEALPENLRRRVIPQSNTQNNTAPKTVTPTQQQKQQVQQKVQETQKRVEDKVKEEVQKGLKKGLEGLGGLFRR